MGDMILGRKGSGLKTMSELRCVVTSVLHWILDYYFSQNKRRVHKRRYYLKEGVHVLYGMG